MGRVRQHDEGRGVRLWLAPHSARMPVGDRSAAGVSGATPTRRRLGYPAMGVSAWASACTALWRRSSPTDAPRDRVAWVNELDDRQDALPARRTTSGLQYTPISSQSPPIERSTHTARRAGDAHVPAHAQEQRARASVKRRRRGDLAVSRRRQTVCRYRAGSRLRSRLSAPLGHLADTCPAK